MEWDEDPGDHAARRWRREQPADERLTAINEALARHVSGLPLVHQFRNVWRPGGAVAPHLVEEWIDQRSEPPEARHHGLYIERSSAVQDFAGEMSLLLGGGMISYRMPGPVDPCQLHVAAGSVGDLLRALGETLVPWTPWQSADIVTFVLTEIAPLVTLASGVGEEHVAPIGTWRRIVLDVDPGASPLVVLELFRQLRADMGTGRHRRAKRSPALLLSFVGERQVQKWPEILEAWNAVHPDLAYSRVTNLMRDYARARRQAGEEESNGEPEEQRWL